MEPGALVVSASKGIENESLKTMDGVLADVLPADVSRTACFLSGPSFAREVGLRYPTAVTMASEDEEAAVRAQAAFQTPYFRVYTTPRRARGGAGRLGKERDRHRGGRGGGARVTASTRRRRSSPAGSRRSCGWARRWARTRARWPGWRGSAT